MSIPFFHRLHLRSMVQVMIDCHETQLFALFPDSNIGDRFEFEFLGNKWVEFLEF